LFVKKDKGKGQEFGFTEYEIAFLTAAVHGSGFPPGSLNGIF